MLSTVRWYAVATQPRHEKVVTEQLQSGHIEAFLPLVKTPSRWKDRRVILDRPIFPGYVFTRLDLADRRSIYSVPGVVRIVSFNGRPAPIEDDEIEGVRLCLTRGIRPASHPYLTAGERVRVRAGALQGLEGVVVRLKNESRIVVSIALIHQSISAEIDLDLLEPLDAFRTAESRYSLSEIRA